MNHVMMLFLLMTPTDSLLRDEFNLLQPAPPTVSISPKSKMPAKIVQQFEPPPPPPPPAWIYNDVPPMFLPRYSPRTFSWPSRVRTCSPGG